MIFSSNSLHIRTKAVELLKENDIDNLCEINITYLISLLEFDISYAYEDLKGLAGFTCFDQDSNRYRIFLDSITYENCPARTSFTLAHELGHILLGHFKEIANSIYFGNSTLEIEANLFADELLMPTLPIIQHKMNVREIIERYHVSVAAANTKLQNMKKNSIYKDYIMMQKKLLFPVSRTIPQKPVYDSRMRQVDILRDRWLDPDYTPLFERL